MAATDKSSRKWILLGIGIGIVCLLIFAGLILLPYFATQPLSKDQLKEYLATPAPQPAATPSPTPSPGVKKR
jgi:hypothetical protein